MTSRELFNIALSGKKSDRPPFWIMRQAGRYLPEYRELKERHGFLGIVKNPELSVEAALQPIRRFDFDCAIVFSDILVVSEALGFPYKFKDRGGIELVNTVVSRRDIEDMPPKETVREKLSYVSESLRALRAALPNKAVLGFSASPWTLASYMVEGGGSKTGFKKFAAFVKDFPQEFGLLMRKLSDVIGEYMSMQAECGIDAFQIFDSNAAFTSPESYYEQSGQWISMSLKSASKTAPLIVSLGDFCGRFDEALKIGANAYSLGSHKPLSMLKKVCGKNCALQGNLDPSLLESGTPNMVRAETQKIVADMHPLGGHIFNLGGGITPSAKIGNVEALAQAVKDFKGK